MEERTFDLTVPVTRPLRVIWTSLGVIWIILGLMYLQENTLLGAVQLGAGLIVLSGAGLLHRLNRHIIAFNDANLEIDKGLIGHRKIPWSAISDIHLQSMRVEFRLNSGKSLEINFSNMSYSDNQTIKPEMIATATAFAEDNGITVNDSRAS